MTRLADLDDAAFEAAVVPALNAADRRALQLLDRYQHNFPARHGQWKVGGGETISGPVVGRLKARGLLRTDPRQPRKLQLTDEGRLAIAPRPRIAAPKLDMGGDE